MIAKLYRVLRVLSHPGAVRGFMSWRPFSMSSFTQLHSIRQLPLQFQTVIDAGANVGQFARAATEFYPEANVISVEALPEVAKIFRENLKGRSQVRLIETALGNTEGTIVFYPHHYSQSSSALKVRPEHMERHISKKLLPPIEVPITRLDTLFPDGRIAKPALLKLDLQGYELEALRGGTSILAQCDCVLLETVFAEAYDGEPLFEEILGFMQANGFRFERPLAFLNDAKDQIYQMDALFVRAEKA